MTEADAQKEFSFTEAANATEKFNTPTHVSNMIQLIYFDLSYK